MSDQMKPQEPGRHDPKGRDRRREPRLGFSRRCQLVVQAPVWAITTRPLLGTTANLTSVGLRVNPLTTDPGQAQAWTDAIQRDIDVRVEVSLPDVPGFPRMRGSIVWVHSDAPADPEADPLVCSVGVLLSIFSERERNAVKNLLESISREDSGAQ